MATDDPDRHAVIVCQDALARPAPALGHPPPRRPQAGGRGTTHCGPGLGDPIRVGCGTLNRRPDDLDIVIAAPPAHHSFAFGNPPALRTAPLPTPLTAPLQA